MSLYFFYIFLCHSLWNCETYLRFQFTLARMANEFLIVREARIVQYIQLSVSECVNVLWFSVKIAVDYWWLESGRWWWSGTWEKTCSAWPGLLCSALPPFLPACLPGVITLSLPVSFHCSLIFTLLCRLLKWQSRWRWRWCWWQRSTEACTLG